MLLCCIKQHLSYVQNLWYVIGFKWFNLILSKSGCTTYEAVFDFNAEQDTHLDLRQGDLVKVTRKEDNGWWRGTVNDRIGWFPSNYVQAAPQGKHILDDNLLLFSLNMKKKNRMNSVYFMLLDSLSEKNGGLLLNKSTGQNNEITNLILSFCEIATVIYL